MSEQCVKKPRWPRKHKHMEKMAKARSCIFQSSKTTHSLSTIDSLEGLSANSIDISAEMDSSANQNDFLEESLSLPRIHDCNHLAVSLC